MSLAAASLNPANKIFGRVHRAVGTSDDNRNDVLFSVFSDGAPTSNVVYFGGDIQDYEENMKNSGFYRWNLDLTTKVLADKFPFSFIWTIKPSEMEEGTYSVYKTFVESTSYGIPLHHADQKSWVHLYHLLKSAIKNLSDERILDHDTCYKYESIIDLPLILIGFSKGCIVLNQLLYDWDEVNSCDASQLFMNKVKKIYWLDGGHAGSSCFWVTDTVILQHLVSRNIQLEIHVTPFQIMNRHKPFVAKEYKIFLQILNDLKANVINKVHFADQAPSIENHFSLLLSFV